MIGLLGHPELAAHRRQVVSSASSRSADVNFRTICSGLWRFLVAMIIEPSGPLPGSQTLTRRGPSNRGQATASEPF